LHKTIISLSFRYFIRFSFNGATFHGWQRQHNAHSIQAALEDSLTVVLRFPVDVTGAGRTDAGVHALDFYAHFDSPSELTLTRRQDLIHHLNGYLPDSISIHSVLPVRPDAHARFSALTRTYRYFISRNKDPFKGGFSWYYTGKLDLAQMNRGAAMLKKNLDFTSFAKLPAETKTNICHIEHAEWSEEGPILVFTISADRFLRNMVRAVVGTLIELGRGRIDLEDLERIIAAQDRSRAGFSAPANGLFMVSVTYPDDLFLEPL
jgi:tRNA pseudouridine38-40 synthase